MAEQQVNPLGLGFGWLMMALQLQGMYYVHWLRRLAWYAPCSCGAIMSQPSPIPRV